MRYFRNLIEQTINRSREATLSVLGINDDGLRNHLCDQMNSALGEDGCFLAPPVFEHTFGWKESDIALDDLRGNLLSNSLLATFEQAKNYKFSGHMHPYTHQLTAWNTLLSDHPRSTIITSGTGSGKTECFMVPILEDLVRESEKTRNGLTGVRALFLYPLNALINSQQERLDAWTKSYGKSIRFCLYNGNTEEKASFVRKEQNEKPNQILSRELLRKEPSPILMTNATMLEYMLVRHVDNPIIEISREKKSLRWIVLDEAHTYIGSQAAEMSLLLRRVVQAFGRSSEDIRFIATSATIAGEGTEKRLKQYLADLAGVRLDQVDVISGSRVWPEIKCSASELRLDLAAIQKIEPENNISCSRFEQLEQSVIARTIRRSFRESERPIDLNEVISSVEDKLTSSSDIDRQKEVIDWLDIMTGTRKAEDTPPFLKLRIHLFQRMLHGLWACVNPKCTAKSEHLGHWPFGNVYVSQRSRCKCGAPVYELAFCKKCKTPHLLAEDRDGELHQLSPYVADEFSLNYEINEVDEPLDNKVSRPSKKRKTQKLVLGNYSTKKTCYLKNYLDTESLELGSFRSENCIEINHTTVSELICSNCEDHFRSEDEFLRKSYLGSPFYVANVVPTVLEFCPDPDKKDCNGKSPEELPGRGRKLITFTDSRQGTARMAVRMQQEAERSRLRGLVFNVLLNAQSRESKKVINGSSESYEELLAGSKALEGVPGMKALASELREKAENIKQGGSSPVQSVELTWGDMVQDLSCIKDIAHSILDYNKYANPVLFEHSGAQTMVRLLLAREFSRRPKYQNSTETLGLIKVNYQHLGSIKKSPLYWDDHVAVSATEKLATKRTKLTLQDWKDFLKVALDFYVRENTFIHFTGFNEDMQRWMGSRFYPKILFHPTMDIDESNIIKKWPQVRSTNPSRLVKLLEMATGLNRRDNDGQDIIDTWLQAAWSDLISVGVLESKDNGYCLKLDMVTFSLPSVGWVCPLTHRIFDTTFRGLTPYLPRKIMPRDYRCEKINLVDACSLQVDGASPVSKVRQVRSLVAKNDDVKRLRQSNLWTDLCDRTVEGGFYYRTAEHSAQQSASKLQNYEKSFKQGTVNVLNCSTTMEMGVDIGGVSAVVMNNVPPHPANYLQRAGRAGRRNEARAIAYTLCKSDPHNQRVFYEPKWPFITSIPAPNITLSSERIVQRHVNSLLLGIFLRSQIHYDGDRTRITLQWFYVSDNSPYHLFCSWLENGQEDYSKPVQQLVRGTALEGRQIDIIINATIEFIGALEQIWSREENNLNDKLKQATDEPYVRALQLEKSRHENEYLLRDLSARGFLPGYGFPTDVVNLKTYNIEDFKYKKSAINGKSRDDCVYSNKEMPTRGLSIAIREYAPGSQIVIDGRVYRSAGVSLQWHADGQKNEVQKFDIAWRCSRCGATGVKENAYANSASLRCNNCHAPVARSECKEILRPGGFVTDFYEPTSNDITTQKYIRVERPRISLNSVEETALPDSRCGFIRSGHNGSVFFHSSGENETGYAVCLSCGRAESMTADGKVPKSLKPDEMHRPVGGTRGSSKKFDCSGKYVKPNLYLGYQIHTDVLEVFLRNSLNNMWLKDDQDGQVIATTLAVAIRDVIADELGVAGTEMGFGFRLDRDYETEQGRCVIQLYDQVSGGAGFVLSALDNITNILKKAAQKLECPVNCENVCSHCLASKDSRVELEELDRKKANQWLQEATILEHLDLPDEMLNIPKGIYCSIVPLYFIQNAINKMNNKDGAVSVALLMHGDENNWDIENPLFKQTVLSWAINKGVKVQIGIKSALNLSKEQKESFSMLFKFGVSFFETDIINKDNSPFQIVQVSSSCGTYSLFCNNHIAGMPSENWLQSANNIVWASSDAIPLIEMPDIDIESWFQTGKNVSVIDVIEDLNGPVKTLDERLKKIIDSKAPYLAQLIENDQAVSISYTDRYLKSPWYVMILHGFLKLFNNDTTTTVKIQTLAANGNYRPSYLIHHNWNSQEDQSNILKTWLGEKLGKKIEVIVKEQIRDVPHGRTLCVEWLSGQQTRIFLDQGMGYWKSSMSSYERQFQFSGTHEEQIIEISRKYRQARMVNCGCWSTHFTIDGKA